MMAMTAVETVRITLLGGFNVFRGDDALPATAWRHRNSGKTLLKVLGVQPDRRLHREQVCDLLWPEADLDSASAQLRKAIHTVRHALEPGLQARAESSYLTLSGQILCLHPDNVSIDVDEFRRQASDALASDDEAALETAVAAYGGELLPEDRYEEWAEAPRRELTTTYRDILLRLVTRLEDRGDLAGAVDRLRLILAIDASDEAAYFNLMRLYVAMGSRHAALLAYRECRRVLAEEVGVEPSASVESLHAELISGTVERTEVPDGPVIALPSRLKHRTTPFIGRDDLLAIASDQITAASKASGSFFLVGGEPGVGKTRLAEEIARQAAEQGALILWGTAFEEENLLPYSVFGDLLNAYVGSLSAEQRAHFAAEYQDLLPILHLEQALDTRPAKQPAGQIEQSRIFRGVAHLFSDLATQCPIAVVLDDLYLAEPASLQLVKHLARSAARFPWLLVATYRDLGPAAPESLTAFVGSCRRENLCIDIDLGGLDSAECQKLTEALLTGGMPSVGPKVYEWSKGNPLFVTELLQMVRRQGDATLGSLDAKHVPTGVRGVIEERMARLSPECRRSLTLASVAGLQWPFRVIKTAAIEALDPPVSEARLVEAFDAALATRVLEKIAVGDAWGYAFRHPLMQTVLYGSLSRQRRLHFHRVLGSVVEELSPDEVEVLAHHFTRSDDTQRAIRYLRLAAQRAVNLYANEAAQAY